MEIIIGVIFIAVVVTILVTRNKPETTQQIVEEVKAEVAKVEAVVAKVEEEVKAEVAEVKEVVKKTTTRAKKALDVNQDGKVNAKDVVDAVKKARKPRAPKA